MPPEIVGEKMEPERLYDAVNFLLSLQVTFKLYDNSCRVNFKLSSHELTTFKSLSLFLKNLNLPYIFVKNTKKKIH